MLAGYSFISNKLFYFFRVFKSLIRYRWSWRTRPLRQWKKSLNQKVIHEIQDENALKRRQKDKRVLKRMRLNFTNVQEDAEDQHFQGMSQVLLNIKKARLERKNKKAKNAKWIYNYKIYDCFIYHHYLNHPLKQYTK